jgi:hypothetical protein
VGQAPRASLERPEHGFLEVVGHPAASVLDYDQDPVVPAANLKAHRCPRGGVLGRVDQQVFHDPLHLGAVHIQHHR